MVGQNRVNSVTEHPYSTRHYSVGFSGSDDTLCNMCHHLCFFFNGKSGFRGSNNTRFSNIRFNNVTKCSTRHYSMGSCGQDDTFTNGNQDLEGVTKLPAKASLMVIKI